MAPGSLMGRSSLTIDRAASVGTRKHTQKWTDPTRTACHVLAQPPRIAFSVATAGLSQSSRCPRDARGNALFTEGCPRMPGASARGPFRPDSRSFDVLPRRPIRRAKIVGPTHRAHACPSILNGRVPSGHRAVSNAITPEKPPVEPRWIGACMRDRAGLDSHKDERATRGAPAARSNR